MMKFLFLLSFGLTSFANAELVYPNPFAPLIPRDDLPSQQNMMGAHRASPAKISPHTENPQGIVQPHSQKSTSEQLLDLVNRLMEKKIPGTFPVLQRIKSDAELADQNDKFMMRGRIEGQEDVGQKITRQDIASILNGQDGKEFHGIVLQSGDDHLLLDFVHLCQEVGIDVSKLEAPQNPLTRQRSQNMSRLDQMRQKMKEMKDTLTQNSSADRRAQSNSTGAQPTVSDPVIRGNPASPRSLEDHVEEMTHPKTQPSIPQRGDLGIKDLEFKAKPCHEFLESTKRLIDLLESKNLPGTQSVFGPMRADLNHIELATQHNFRGATTDGLKKHAFSELQGDCREFQQTHMRTLAMVVQSNSKRFSFKKNDMQEALGTAQRFFIECSKRRY